VMRIANICSGDELRQLTLILTWFQDSFHERIDMSPWWDWL
jgi:hypothetical protein